MLPGSPKLMPPTSFGTRVLLTLFKICWLVRKGGRVSRLQFDDPQERNQRVFSALAPMGGREEGFGVVERAISIAQDSNTVPQFGALEEHVEIDRMTHASVTGGSAGPRKKGGWMEERG